MNLNHGCLVLASPPLKGGENSYKVVVGQVKFGAS